MNKLLAITILFLITSIFMITPTLSSASSTEESCVEAEMYIKEALLFLELKPQISRKLLSEADALCEDNVTIKYNLALADILDKKPDDALLALADILDIKSDHLKAKRAMAYATSLSSTSEGKTIIGDMLDSNPNDEQTKRIKILILLGNDADNTTILRYLQPVKPDTTIDNYKILDGDVVLDTETNLKWARTAPEEVRYGPGRKYCDALELGGISEWRLPTKDEIKTLVNMDEDPQDDKPLFNTKAFPNSPAGKYWIKNNDPVKLKAYDMVNKRTMDRTGPSFTWCVTENE